MITDGRWKMIVYHVNGAQHVQRFDLANDPHEIRDLASGKEWAAIVTRLAARLRAWQQRIGDPWMRSPVAGAAATPSR